MIKFAWGVNAYSNFGTKTSFQTTTLLELASMVALTDASVMSEINIGLAGSYRLNQQWSFGAGLDLNLRPR